MTKPEDPTPTSEPAPRPSVPSWVDEVLRAEPTPTPTRPATEGTGDLRIPEEPRPQPAPTVITATTRPAADEDDWIARATGGAARSPSMPVGEPQAAPPPSGPLHNPGSPAGWLQPQRSASSATVPADIAQKKLIAGLLAIVLGGLGVHKFYLGMNTPGAIMLGVSVGVWILALLLGLITLGLGLIITLPLAGLISGAVGLLGLIEGILYLTKSDEDFYLQYVLGKKPWL